MSRIKRFLGTPFGLATLACTVLAGWALWTGGILDTPIQRTVRSGNLYVAPGVTLDRDAAARVIGNRRLVVLFLPPGSDMRSGCKRVGHAADGTLVLTVSIAEDGFHPYGCLQIPGADDENIGKAVVAETVIASGMDQFAGRPVEALKVAVVNYDRLVKSDILPDGARAITPPLSRFLIAAAAVLSVLLGAALLWLMARRAGRLAVQRQARREAAGDSRAALSAAVATLAQQLIDLDARGGSKKFRAARARLSTDYLAMLDDLATARDGEQSRRLTAQVQQLIARAHRLSEDAPDQRGQVLR